jgi:hypothetical protein
MEGFFWVIIAVIYLILSLAGGSKNKNKKPQQPTQKDQSTSSSMQDDKLKEIIKRITEQNKPAQTTQSNVYENYETTMESYSQPKSIEVYPSDTSYESGALESNQTYDSYEYDTETEDLESYDFDKSEKKPAIIKSTTTFQSPKRREFTKKSQYDDLLKSKEDIKRAFIAAEIFKTKF